MIKVLLFDAANTLIYKPDLLTRISSVLGKHDYVIPMEKLRFHHKLVSEIINFPDRTDNIFYDYFNTELLLSLGIAPDKKMLEEIFAACTYLPWNAFDDCKYISNYDLKKCVLSNFNSGLNELMEKLLPGCFNDFIVSEKEGCRKPDTEFYQLAIKRLNVNPEEIAYFGDSLKLDVIPAQKCGINAILIDRSNEFTNFRNRISSFDQIPAIIDKLNKQ